MKKSDEQRNEWDRLPEETTKAYGAFIEYLELSPNVRSVYRAEMKSKGRPYNTKGMKKASSRWKEWYRTFRWQERAQLYDSYSLNLRLKRKEEALDRAQDKVAQDHSKIHDRLMARLESEIDNIPPQALVKALKDTSDTTLKALGHEEKAKVTTVNEGTEPVTTLKVHYVMPSRDIQGEGGVPKDIDEADITYTGEENEPTIN